MDGTSAETTHDLLLALAGWVDDDLLAWARELVAVDEARNAVELLTATLVADQVELPEETRAAVVAASRSTRTELDADTTLAPHRATIGTSHRFDGGPADAVVDALRALPARLLVDCRASLARRLTPAGSAPGPLPHPVVLIEVTAGSRNRDVLAYQLADALDRAGVGASVEVITTGDELPAYHAEALRSAQPVRSGEPGSAEPSSNRSTTPIGSPGGPPPRPVPVRAGARAWSSLGGTSDGSGRDTSSAEPDRAPITATAASSDTAGSDRAGSDKDAGSETAGSDTARRHTVPTRPVPTRPVPTQPVPTQPVPTQPVPTQPVPTQPVPTQPVPTQPVPTQPVPTQPVPTQPVPTQPVPTQPVPTQPVPTQPVPTQPVPTRPVPTQSVPARPISTRPVPKPPLPARAVRTRPAPVR